MVLGGFMMEVYELDRDRIWERALERFDGTFYHTLLWRDVVEKIYGLDPIYLIAEEDGIVGALPTFRVGRIRKRLISIPFSPYGGVLGGAGKDLIRRALEIEDKIELRGFGESDHLCTFILELNDDLWRKMGKKTRNSIRKAEKSGLEFSIEDRLEDFYYVYTKNMHRLGAPTHPIEFFELLLDSDSVEMGVVSKGERLVAGAILLEYNGSVISGWAGSDDRYLSMCPNNLLYWGCIKYACSKEFRYFDFGRSIVGSGTYRFKRGWGGKEVGLNYVRIPEGGMDTSMRNPMRRMFAKVWRRIPYGITRAMSPLLRGLFP